MDPPMDRMTPLSSLQARARARTPVCVAVSQAACLLLSHKMDEYDELYTYLESGTYPERLSKDGNITIVANIICQSLSLCIVF